MQRKQKPHSEILRKNVESAAAERLKLRTFFNSFNQKLPIEEVKKKIEVKLNDIGQINKTGHK